MSRPLSEISATTSPVGWALRDACAADPLVEAGIPTPSVLRPTPSHSGRTTMPDRLLLLDLHAACRRAADRAFLEARAFTARTSDLAGFPEVSRQAADLAAHAMQLHEASQHFAQAAADAEGLALAAHRAGGGDVILVPAVVAVVVGDQQHPPAAANDRLRERVAVAVRRLLRRSA